MIDGPVEEPVGSTDQYALQVTERMRESFRFMHEYSGKPTERMKTNYDAAIKQKSFAVGSYVLLFSLKNKRGTFTYWQATWIGPYRIMRKLNETNYILQKSPRSKDFIVHGDRIKLYHRTVDSKLWQSDTDKGDSSISHETMQLSDRNAAEGQPASQGRGDRNVCHPDTYRQRAGSREQAVTDKGVGKEMYRRSRPNNKLAMTSS